jgi:WD40 repeat protein
VEDVWSLAFTPNGRELVTNSGDGTIKFWDLVGEPGPGVLKVVSGPGHALAFSPDGLEIAIVDDQGILCLYDVVTGRERLALPVLSASTVGLLGALAGAGPLQAAAALLTNRAERLRIGPGKPPDSLATGALSPDGRFFAASFPGKEVRLFNRITGREQRPLKGFTGGASCLVFSPNGRFLAAGSWDLEKVEVHVWDVVAGKELHKLGGPKLIVTDVAFSPDSTLLVGGSLDGSVRVWDVQTGKERSVFEDDPIVCVAFSSDGRLAWASGDKVTIFDMMAGQKVLKIECYSHYVFHMAFSPDGKRLATGGLGGG